MVLFLLVGCDEYGGESFRCCVEECVLLGIGEWSLLLCRRGCYVDESTLIAEECGLVFVVGGGYVMLSLVVFL